MNLGEGSDNVKVLSGATLIIESGAVLNLGDDADTFTNAGSLTIAGSLLLGDGNDAFDNDVASSSLTINPGGLLDFGTGNKGNFSSVGEVTIREEAGIDNATDFDARRFLTLEIGGTETPETPVLNLPTASKVRIRDLSIVIDYVGVWRPREGETFSLLRARDRRNAAYRELDISDADGFGLYAWESVVDAHSGINELVVTVLESPRPDFGPRTISDQTYVLNTDFEETLPEASGGAGMTDYSLAPASGGILPNWLMFDSATRRLSGTPTGLLPPTELLYTAVDQDGEEAVIAFSITVEAGRPYFGARTISDQTYVLNTAFAETLPEAPGGAGTTDYSLTHASGDVLPDWLMFDPATRRLSGTPTGLLAPTDLLYTAVDDASLEAVLAFSITVEAPPPSFGNQTISDQTYVLDALNAAFAETLPEASGGAGTTGYSLTLASGDVLPNWLIFDSATRRLSGTPTGLLPPTELVYTAVDDASREAVLTFSITVEAPPPGFGDRTISDQTYVLGVAFDETLPEASGGAGTTGYGLAAASGDVLPDWLIFDLRPEG